MVDNEDSCSKERQAELLEEIEAAITEKAWRTAEHKIHEYLRYVPHCPDAMMYLGISRAAQGCEPEGESHLLASLTMEPKNKRAYYHLGLIVLDQGRCIFAHDAFKKGLEIDPTDHALLYQLGRALERLGQLEEAFETYKKALENSPEHEDLDFTQEAREAVERLRDPDARTSEKSWLELE